jgi:hypothetical protein
MILIHTHAQNKQIERGFSTTLIWGKLLFHEKKSSPAPFQEKRLFWKQRKYPLLLGGFGEPFYERKKNYFNYNL